MNVGLQTPRIINALDSLNPADASMEIPSIDPSVLTPTFPIDSAWMGLESHAIGTPTTSINGATVSFHDDVETDWATIFPVGIVFDSQQNRMVWMTTTLAGGAVSPIRVRLSWTNGLAGFDIWQGSVTNPGVISIGPIIVPASFQLRIRVGAGGAGDTTVGTLLGFQSPAGVGFPSIGGWISNTV